MSRKTIRTQKAEIIGDNVTKIIVNRQTGNHEGQTCTVKKEVTITYEDPAPRSAVHEIENIKKTASADLATVNAKSISNPAPVSFKGRNQQKIKAKRDVTISYVESEEKRRSNSCLIASC